MAEQDVLHRQSREVWEKRSVELDWANKRYIIRLTKLLDEKASLQLALKDERNTALLTVVELRRENSYLRAKNHELKKEALSEVIEISKSWVVKAFEILAEADDVPRHERRLDFQESLHKATLAGKELPIFKESSDDEEEEGEADSETQADDTNDPLELNA